MYIIFMVLRVKVFYSVEAVSENNHLFLYYKRAYHDIWVKQTPKFPIQNLSCCWKYVKYLVISFNLMETLRELFKNHFEAALKVLLFHCEPEMWAL